MSTSSVQEREIENLLEQQLARMGYVYDFGNADRDVFMQAPKSQEEVALLNNRRPDYMIYLSAGSTQPDIIIEVKKPNMKLKDALLQGLDYAGLLAAKIVIVFDGHTLKSFLVSTGDALKINGVEVKEILHRTQYQHYINGNTADLTTVPLSIESKQDLINVFSFANTKLRKAGVQKGIERFTEFTNLLFLKLVSEDSNEITEEVPEHLKWDSYKNKKGEELISYINDTVVPGLERVFNRQDKESMFSKLLIRDTAALKQIIDKLDQINLAGIETDIKGDAFEYFIQKYNSNNKDLGEYFTPRHIVNFMVKLANIQYGEKVYDPFCGTGGMLISAFQTLQKELKEKDMLTDAVKNDLKENMFYGSEISSTAKISKMNMILTGDGHSNIKQQDTLLQRLDNVYDVIISNIPFNLQVDKNDQYFTLNTQDGNSLCMEHIIAALKDKPTSRAYVIVPEGFLNNGISKNTRKLLIDSHLLKGIISLPVGVFLPYADAKASILVLQGRNNQPVNDVFYYKVKNDGYTLTTRRRKKEGFNDLDEFLSTSPDDVIKISCANIRADSDYSLLHFRYDKTIPAGHVSLVDVIRETKIKNTEGYPTVTITNSDFYGIALGEDYWGENFVSVTSKTNFGYRVIKKNHISYNPARANIGSIGINITDNNYAVSSAYPTFEVFNDDFLPEYVYLYLKSNAGMEDIVVRCFGSARQNLRFDDLLSMNIPKVEKDLQRKICKNAKDVYRKFLDAKAKMDKFEFRLTEGE